MSANDVGRAGLDHVETNTPDTCLAPLSSCVYVILL